MLKELFEKNKNIIINTDIDGFLCGMILQKYYGCKVVGFSNSRDTIWVSPEINDIYSPIYIDIFVNNPNVICIDQHIIAFNKQHHNKLVGYGTKINPNLDRERTFVGDIQSDYFHKYPFGTVHYIIALMAKEGIEVELPDLYKNYNVKNFNINAGHIILRADDALFSTLGTYRENALDWWQYLNQSNSKAIKDLTNFIDLCDINKNKEYKENIASFFKLLDCDGIDGAFNTITDTNGYILEKVVKYIRIISKIMGMELTIPEYYYTYKGVYKIDKRNKISNMDDILKSESLYSYAFIFGPFSKNSNFSYTIDMKIKQEDLWYT